MILRRVERHIIDRQSKWFKILREKCFLAKNVYNHGNYLIRQEFFNSGNYLGYSKVEKLMHDDVEFPDYWNLGLANSSQQIIRSLDKNWKSFFKSIKDWAKHKDKYLGMPKPPKYLKKDRLKDFALTYAQIHVSDGFIEFPKSISDDYGNRMKIHVCFPNKPEFKKFQMCRVIPRNDRIILEFVYTVDIEVKKLENQNIAAIDLGLDNFVTLVNNIGEKPVIINGKGLKSCNQYYNKKIAELKSKLDTQYEDKRYSHKLYSITNKRNDKVDYFMHKASNFIVSYCKQHNISTLVVGKNDGWKQETNIGKVNNQNFVQIPYLSLISKLTYKCEQSGISLILTEESYTSGTSFLDNEQPTKEFYNKSRRIKRGLFKSNSGKLINADVNAAYQIMKKVFCDAEMPADRGFVMNPLCYTIKF